MRIDVISIFPDYLEPLRLSLVGKAIEAGIVSLGVHDLRDWTYDRHRTTDDTPYGGGAGMVMRPEPWGDALDAVASAESRLVLLSPAGRPFTQAVAYELAAEQHLVLACGRYEGIDARVAQDAARRMPVTELSIGDYVLTGGEAAALVVIEAVVRLLPGVLGNPASLAVESYSAGHDGLLEGPVYTKPPLWRGLEVPPVLISGHHAKIDAWRRQQALEQTRRLRPDLLPDDLDGLVISYAQPPDAGELLTLQRGAFVAEGRLNGSFEIPPLTEDLAGMEASLATGTVLIARLRGRLIASVRGEERPNRRWYVGRLMVAPDRLRQGIGSVMMEAIEALAPPGTEAISLLTGAASVATLGYYRRRGYVDVERVDTAEGVPVVIMERRVEP